MSHGGLDDGRIARLSPPDTVLGMLQRGRGEGFLAAKSLPIDDARDLVWQCVVHDPRWDLQVESRAEYYAALIEELGLDIGRFRAEHCPKPLDDVDQRLVVDVLGELANRGHALATKALLTHVRPSAQWDDAIYELSRLPKADYFEQLIEELETNFEEEDRARVVARWKEEIPWADFAPERAWVQRGFVMKQEWSQLRGRAPELPDVAESAEVLLAYPWPPVLPKWLVHRLTHMLREGELELILDAVKEPGSAQWVAFNVLGGLNHPGAVEVATAILEAGETGLGRRGARRYVGLLAPEYTLPLARSWYASSDGRATAARGIFALHAEHVDTPLLVDQLKEAWSRRDFYSLCSYAQALELHPTAVPWGMCSEIFEQTEYSYSRGVVAETLVAADRARFIEQYGVAAAFDCNARVRDLVAGDD